MGSSCDPHPIPAPKLLNSHNRSDRGACGFVLTGQPDRIQNGISFGLSAFQSERSLPQLNVESRVTALGGLELNLVSLVVLVDVNDHRLLERLG